MAYQDDTPKPALIYLPWEIEFNAIYLKRGFSVFETHSAFWDVLVKHRVPIKVNWLRAWLNYGPHPDDRIDPGSSRGQKYVYELHEPKEGDDVIPPGISKKFWDELVAANVDEKDGGKVQTGGLSMADLKLKYPELAAQAEKEI